MKILRKREKLMRLSIYAAFLIVSSLAFGRAASAQEEDRPDSATVHKLFPKGGNRQEKVYDVAWSGDRKPGTDGKLPAVGNTVDVAHAVYTNTIGAPELIAMSKDPDFDSRLRAVYYARVIEIPTPRWTCYDAVRFGVTMDPHVLMTMTERAYTSPIWYTPSK